jgi:DNA recombination protein RmuC
MSIFQWAILALLCLLQLVLLIALLWRSRGAVGASPDLLQPLLQQLQQQIQQPLLQISQSQQTQQQLYSELAHQLREDAKAGRMELANHFAQVQQTQTTQMQGIAASQQAGFKLARDELAAALQRFSQANAQSLSEIRATLEQKISQLQADNGQRLEQMRQTVDEKLHATLEQRLGESFKLVSERLEKVHQGLGEMQQLALGVGDLKRVLTNVKTRGTWGEVQLAMLLEQLLTADQYAANVETIPGSNARVEFAIKLPGAGNGPMWLPIDAKFPKEQYERLVQAAEVADADAVALAGRELERAVRLEAKTIAEKYLSPPLTTDFAILFLPTEGLYAEVMRRPGLADAVQRECRVSIAGPSTLLAMLNSLQMGFRTLALEKRSSEVWQVLGAVKTEFGKFGDVLANIKLSLEKAAKNIDSAEVRSRQMARKLKSVEALPSEAAQLLLGSADEPE